MRGILDTLIRQRRDRAWVVAEFKRLCPDYQQFHKAPIGDGALWGRADKGTRPEYEAEHPEFNAAMKVYLPWARGIVARGEPVSAAELTRRSAGRRRQRTAKSRSLLSGTANRSRSCREWWTSRRLSSFRFPSRVSARRSASRATAKALAGTGWEADRLRNEMAVAAARAFVKNSSMLPYKRVELIPHYRRSGLDEAAQ